MNLKDYSRQKEALTALQAMRGAGAPPQLEQNITELESIIEKLSQARFCYEAQILKASLIPHWKLSKLE